MAFALTSARAAPLVKEIPFRQRYIEVLELTFTAANTDTALALGTVAAAATADIGKVVVDSLRKAKLIKNYFFLESPRVLSASGVGHVLSGTAKAPTFTFAGSTATPTALTLVIELILGDDEDPLIQND